MSRDAVVPELLASERRISEIKDRIDQFEQKFNQVIGGYATHECFNQQYHNLILSTRDLPSQLANIRKASELSDQDPDIRAKAHTLNNQAITQLRRIQNLGMRSQQYLRSRSTDVAKQEQFPSPLDNIPATGTQLSTIQLQHPQNELDEQRAHEMEQLESDIVQVNELFTTLATYVHDQGFLVDSIDKHIEVAYEQVEAGTHQLDKAVKHQKSARRKKCICIFLLILFLVVIALIIGLSLRK